MIEGILPYSKGMKGSLDSWVARSRVPSMGLPSKPYVQPKTLKTLFRV